MSEHVRRGSRAYRRGTIASDLAHHTTQEDAFHEIQLNGKQLFFLFMAATVVSVVIFLCGVLVGRGVRAERSVVAEAEVLSASPSADVQPAPPAGATPAPGAPTAPRARAAAGADPTIVPPPPPADDIGDVRPNAPPDAIDASKTVAADVSRKADEVKPSLGKAEKSGPSEKASKPGKVASPSTPTAVAALEKPAVIAAEPPRPASDGWVVQVAAVNTRNDADEFVKGLTTKGFSAFVVAPAAGTSIYRVRVGSFKTKGEADTMAEKLRKEMGMKPWVTR